MLTVFSHIQRYVDFLLSISVCRENILNEYVHNISLVFAAQVYESGEFNDQTENGQQQQVLGHIPVGDGMVSTITLLDPNQHQQLQEETKQRKRKTKPLPYQTQFAHLTQVHSL